MTIRKLKLRESDNDYVEINGMKLPKDYVMNVLSKAKDMGFDSPEVVSNKDNTTKSTTIDEPKESEFVATQEQDEIRNECLDIIINANLDINKKLDELFDILVPSSGKCNTEAGELIRAINRIMYRDYNDGDLFYTGYGVETCAPCVAYIIDTVGNYEDISDTFDLIKNKELIGTQYSSKVKDIAGQLLFYLNDYDSTFYAKPIYDCIKYNSETLEEIIADDRNHEYEADVYDLQQYVNEGYINTEDIYYFLSDLCSNYGGDVESDRYDNYFITNLSGEELDAWEEMYPRELNAYIELIEEESAEFSED